MGMSGLQIRLIKYVFGEIPINTIIMTNVHKKPQILYDTHDNWIFYGGIVQ